MYILKYLLYLQKKADMQFSDEFSNNIERACFEYRKKICLGNRIINRTLIQPRKWVNKRRRDQKTVRYTVVILTFGSNNIVDISLYLNWTSTVNIKIKVCNGPICPLLCSVYPVKFVTELNRRRRSMCLSATFQLYRSGV